MKKVIVFRNDGGGKVVKVSIEAPPGKEMVFDGAMLQHGILMIGEYGPSGTKVAAFKNWEQATFLEGDEGYTVVAKNL